MRPVYVFDNISLILLRMKNFSDRIFKEHKTFYVQKFFSENRAVYEIMWKNIVQPDSPQMTIWHMCITCWITKATNTHSEYVIRIAFPQQHFLQECASMLCVHCLSYCY